MSRGVVLRFADEPTNRLTRLWDSLTAAGVPALRTHTHGKHVPHLSLVVADRLHNEAAIHALADLAPPPSVQLEAVGYFPQGVLHLVPVPARDLLAYQAAVHERLAAAGALKDIWPTSAPDAWFPHVTLAHLAPAAEVFHAFRLAADTLPLACSVAGIWIEDGDSGECWAVP